MRTGVVFSHQAVSDPFAIYDDILTTAPVYYDSKEKLWGVYSYDLCLQVLQMSEAWIPKMPLVRNHTVDALADGLARLANDADHQVRRETAARLFASWQHPDVNGILEDIFKRKEKNEVFDWVKGVGVRLPAITLLRGFKLREDAIERIITVLPGLVKLMNPVKTKPDVDEILGAYEVVLEHAAPVFANSGFAKNSDKNFVVSNFIGLLIQGYDSGIGSLCNILTQYIWGNYPPLKNEEDVTGFVLETFRYAPAFHNTRRVMKMPLHIEDKTIQIEDTVVVFLAAANRDRKIFENPGKFDRRRTNAGKALTFGSGPHACIARGFSESLGCALLNYLLESDLQPELIDQTIVYQNKVNARIPASLIVLLNEK